MHSEISTVTVEISEVKTENIRGLFPDAEVSVS